MRPGGAQGGSERAALVMGGSQSVDIPGGGSEGYHVLKARPGAFCFDDTVVNVCVCVCVCVCVFRYWIILRPRRLGWRPTLISLSPLME